MFDGSDDYEEMEPGMEQEWSNIKEICAHTHMCGSPWKGQKGKAGMDE